ncbi:TetR/AcrR family transcriptional regulator C-terminal domain-containing protein [Actinoplanes sp. TBRC 11911]|uniref:TetR/AcrR family transcriptional regulator C-terminal domain-containing protein n=1 Tax=Actinoplanes sp. TBRC 11911 TaxID=2729386 RepID=UPI0028A18961|nr:TetR/AcrR family transcriptional regulator C-terminal domain-containing protein [Actinoplanes sp. TBRC 11911]
MTYKRIVADIRGRIESGDLRPGDRVPSARAMTKEWGVAIATAIKAQQALRDQGLTVARPGVGTIVAGPAPRAPKQHELSRDRIVATAVEIADADGITEVTMRRIASTLGVATMSLYRHVPSRDDLIQAMIDAAFDGLRLPARPDADWRRSLQLNARTQWALFQRHPWLGPTMSITRPQLAPNAIRLSEWVMAAFDGTALTMSERMYIQILFFSFVRGVASALEPEAVAIQDSGLTNDQWMETQTSALLRVMDDSRLPRFRELATAGFDYTLDQLFEFGLVRLLDGLALFVDARS